MTIGGDDVVVLRAPLVGDARYGREERDWDNASATAYRGVNVQPFGIPGVVAETNIDREFFKTHWRLYGPPDMDITNTDRLICRGITYEVDGSPEVWHDEGRPDHVMVGLRRIAG